MFPLPRSVLPFVGLVCLLALGTLIYLWFFKPAPEEADETAVPADHIATHVPARRPSHPFTYPPVYPTDLPTLTHQRNWSPTLESYLNLIIVAIDAPSPCCLPIDPTFLPAILAWYEEAREDIAVHLRILHPGSTSKMARVVVSSTESPTGKHRAIR